MKELLSLAGLIGLMVLFLLALKDSLARRREQDAKRLDELPFDAGVSDSDQLSELSEIYASGQGMDKINRTGVP